MRLLLREHTDVLKCLLKFVTLVSGGGGIRVRNLVGRNLDFEAGLFPLYFATLKEE